MRTTFPLLLALLLCAGCAGDYAMSPASERSADYGGEYEQDLARADSSGEGGGTSAPGDDGFLADAPSEETPSADIDDKGAPLRPAPKAPSGAAVEPGRSTPLLIYTADLHLAVFQVQSTQKKLIALAKKLGGFLSRQSDQLVVVRVPARAFDQCLNGVEGLGDVVHRQVAARDVTEEFRDLAIRLRNFESVRAQLAKLLERANKVKDALEVQRELTKITENIERLKGRLRFLEDRIAFSTISVHFQPRPRDDAAGGAPPAFRLPFSWVHELGLQSLMDVR
jgi:hypothetical protein